MLCSLTDGSDGAGATVAAVWVIAASMTVVSVGAAVVGNVVREAVGEARVVDMGEVPVVETLMNDDLERR